MLKEELNLGVTEFFPIKAALTTFAAFVSIGFVPLFRLSFPTFFPNFPSLLLQAVLFCQA